MSQHEGSEFVRHVPCATCGSSDANSLYTDGHTFCFACKAHTRGEGEAPTTQRREKNPALIQNLTYQALGKRKLTEESCIKWQYGIADYQGHKVQVANYFSPDGSEVVAQKVRFPDKKFIVLGDIKKAGLYGQHLWRDGGKMVVVTEGEIDSISVSQVQNHKWPVVSVTRGADGAAKNFREQIDWLEKFESVIIMFDQDKPHIRPDGTVHYPGQDAAKECAEILSPGRAKIAALPLKDANEMLQAGRGSEIVNAMWGAKSYRPDGVVAGTDLWEAIITPPKPGDFVPFPYRKLQAMTLGMRKGELIIFAAGSGVGKSEMVRQVYSYLCLDHNETLGLIHLEEKVTRSSLGMMGYYLKRRLNLGTDGVSQEKLREAYDKTVGSGRVFLYDHFGSADSNNLFAKIRYFAKGCNCTTIVLDHISMVVSGIADGDERRIIDNLMTRLATLAQELNVRIILITHLKKPEGTPHEEGGHVSLDDFRGSGSIKQLSHTAIGLERNQQDQEKKNFTLIRLLKCRETGETGEAGWLSYDPITGILTEIDSEPCFKDETQTTKKDNEDF